MDREQDNEEVQCIPFPIVGTKVPNQWSMPSFFHLGANNKAQSWAA